MNNQSETIKRLSFENYIWIIYIVIAIGNIFGDELIKKSITNHDEKCNNLANHIFTISLIITILIYFYFLERNIYDYQKHKNSKAYQIRLFGSILTFVGIICFLYFQLNVSKENDTVSSI